MCTLKNNLLIQIPVEGLIVSHLHALWLLVMQEWVLHQVVHLCIQDCHTPKREILSVYDRKVSMNWLLDAFLMLGSELQLDLPELL